MTEFAQTHVEAYVFRRRSGRIQFLALRRAPDRRVLPGVWQPVTGKRDRGETSIAAAAREVLEETGLVPRRWWALETVTLYVEPGSDRLTVLPLFAAEVGASEHVALSEEHDAFAWLDARAAGARYLWESQRRGIEAVRREVLRGGPLARALEIEPKRNRSRTQRRRAAPGASTGVRNAPRRRQ